MSNEKQIPECMKERIDSLSLTITEKHEIINSTIGRMGELEKASIKYFLETGSVNGSFMQRIYEVMDKVIEKAAIREFSLSGKWVKCSERLPEGIVFAQREMNGHRGWFKGTLEIFKDGAKFSNQYQGSVDYLFSNSELYEIEWLESCSESIDGQKPTEDIKSFLEYCESQISKWDAKNAALLISVYAEMKLVQPLQKELNELKEKINRLEGNQHVWIP